MATMAVMVAAMVTANVVVLLLILLLARLVVYVVLSRPTVPGVPGWLVELLLLILQLVPYLLLVIEAFIEVNIPPNCSRVHFCAKYGWFIHKAMLILSAFTILPRIRSLVDQYFDWLPVAIYSGEQDTVPFTNRTRFVRSFTEEELRMGASMFKEEKEKLGAKVLQEDHEDSKRAHRIITKIVEAAEKIKPQTHEFHNGWEVIVIKDDKEITAWCRPGCKIAVYTGLLKNFEDDAELATVLSHEVAHAIARHTMEGRTRSILGLGVLKFYELLLLRFARMPRSAARSYIHTLHKYFLRLPWSRRKEIEADHIGLLLLASAGYDPRVAPSVLKKLGDITGDSSEWNNCGSTHPSLKKRAQFLLRDHVMEEALNLYSESASQTV